MTSDSAQLESRLKDYASRDVSRVKVGFTDVDGVLRGKYVSLAKFAKLLTEGGGWCDCVFGWDLDDALYESPASSRAFTGWHTGFPDARFELSIGSERWLADEGCPLFLAQFAGPAEDRKPPCPRSLCHRSLQRLTDRGWQVRSGFEYEFFVFDETAESVRAKGYRDLTPFTPGNFGYSMLRTSTHGELFSEFMASFDALGCPIEGLHTETGPGVWEAALAPADGLEAADRATLFKTFAKVFLARRELLATFMAKWSMAVPGQSGHYHFSLEGNDGESIFRDAEAADGMSVCMRQALAGMLSLLPEWLPMLAPTINSYTRLVRGAWAPTAATWGVENRTAALRVIPGAGQRIECRVSGADTNPYLVCAAVAAAARVGIERQLQLDPAVAGNAYDVEARLPAERQFAPTLRAATERFAASADARAAFGDAWVDHFVMTRDWECREYERHVNDWQLGRYFELI